MSPPVSNKLYSESTSCNPYHKPQINLREAISSINATEIKLISTQIISLLVDRLGKQAKSELETSTEQESAPLLTDDQKTSLHTALLPFIQEALTEQFTLPDDFIKKGIDFDVSSEMPLVWITSIARIRSIDLSRMEIPQQYTIHLTLDQHQSYEKGDLIFKIKEKSDLKLLNTTTFDLFEIAAAEGCIIS